MRSVPLSPRWWVGPLALAAACAVGGTAFGWQDPPPDDASAVQVLTQGPIHEAFAEPVVYDPRPGPVVPKQPPAPVEEVPPDQKPEGDNVQWIPGYWAWDDGRNDFLWISGIWRAVPPGRQWVPGYWNQAGQGFQWVPGVWAPLSQPDQGDQAAAQPLQYLPTPPPSIEAGPNTPPPSDNVTWSPGCWVWSENRYVWRPGFWVPVQPDWLWVPAHYSWTPSGSMFIDGYWDRPLTSRGQMFAPVYFQQPVYSQPNYTYTPSVGILATALMSSLFVRPSYSSYYFGDYYGGNSAQSGIYPWYSYHQSRYGYDPIYAYASQVNSRRDPQWVDQIHETYRYRREHPEARPPRTYAEQTRIVNTVTNVNSVSNVTNINNVTNNLTTVNNVNNARNLVLARPIKQIAANTQSPVRFQKLDEGARREITRQSGEVRQFHEQRVRQETQAAKLRPADANPAEARPRAVQLPKSPIAAPLARRTEGAPAGDRARTTPPPPPSAPKPNPAVRPEGLAQQPPARHEPGLDQKPPEHLRPVVPGYRPPPGPGPRVETPRPEPVKPVAPKPEASRPEPPRPVVPKPEAPRPEPVKPVAPKPEAPRPEPVKPVAPRPATPRPGATASEAFGAPGQPGRPTGNAFNGQPMPGEPGRPGFGGQPGGLNAGQPLLGQPGSRPAPGPSPGESRQPGLPGQPSPGNPPPFGGAPGQPTPGRPGQPPPGMAVPPQFARPGQPQPGLPGQPQPGLPGQPLPGQPIPPGLNRPAPGQPVPGTPQPPPGAPRRPGRVEPPRPGQPPQG